MSIKFFFKFWLFSALTIFGTSTACDSQTDEFPPKRRPHDPFGEIKFKNSKIYY